MKVHLDSISLFAHTAGRGQPVLFIHGYPLNGRMWSPQLQGLGDHARLIAPDLRGHGDSDVASGPYAMSALADDCAALLDSLEVAGPVVVCGLSMGGYATFAFYRRHRARVAGLILAATRAGADSPEGKAARDRAAAQAEAEGPESIVAAMLPKMMAPATYEENPALVERVRSIMAATSLEGILGDLQGMRDRPNSTDMLTEIEVPTLVVHGADDQILPQSEAESMAAAIPGAKLEILPGAGHLLNLEQPERFNRAVREFLSGI
jgi:pimeloyl-ACP methyl ester carboxylesterase